MCVCLCCTQEVANVLWALTSLRASVKQVWLLSVCERAKRCMPEFKPQVRSKGWLIGR